MNKTEFARPPEFNAKERVILIALRGEFDLEVKEYAIPFPIVMLWGAEIAAREFEAKADAANLKQDEEGALRFTMLEVAAGLIRSEAQRQMIAAGARETKILLPGDSSL